MGNCIVVVDFEEYEMINQIKEARKQKIQQTAEQLIEENLESFMELAK